MPIRTFASLLCLITVSLPVSSSLLINSWVLLILICAYINNRYICLVTFFFFENDYRFMIAYYRFYFYKSVIHEQ